jgi:hypothetical protein
LTSLPPGLARDTEILRFGQTALKKIQVWRVKVALLNAFPTLQYRRKHEALQWSLTAGERHAWRGTFLVVRRRAKAKPKHQRFAN